MLLGRARGRASEGGGHGWIHPGPTRSELHQLPAGGHRLPGRLADRYGAGQVFKDVDSIELGDDFVEVITRAVGSCDVVLALIGPQWLTRGSPQYLLLSVVSHASAWIHRFGFV
jgi:hypothetical protein